MLDMKCVLFSCFSLCILGANAGAVSFIDPCGVENDKQCLLKSANKAMPYLIKGDPGLKMESLNPLIIPYINGDDGDLKLKIRDLKIHRLAECKIIALERPEKYKITIILECPITATGDYDLSGKFYVLKVIGKDKCEIKTEKIKIEATINIDKFEKSGIKYYKIVNFDFSYIPIKKVYFDFKNLNNGDATAEPIKKILDESWEDIINGIAKPIVKELILHVVKSVGKVFSSVPINELEKA